MYILRYTFNLLTIFGCWRPDSWSSLCKRITYHVYTSIVILIVNTFMLSVLMDVIWTINNGEDFFDNFFPPIATFISSCKVFILLMNRKNIIMLINILRQKLHRPSSSTEMEILNNFDKNIQ